MLQRVIKNKEIDSSDRKSLNNIPEDILILLFTFLGDKQTFKSIYKIKELAWGLLLAENQHRIYLNLLREEYRLDFSGDEESEAPDAETIYQTIQTLKKTPRYPGPRISQLSLFVKVINRILRLKDNKIHLIMATDLLDKIHVDDPDFCKLIFIEAAKKNCFDLILFAVNNDPYNRLICGYDTCHHLSLSETENIRVLEAVLHKLIDGAIGKTCQRDDTTCPGNDRDINLLSVYKKLARYGSLENIKSLMPLIRPREGWRQVLQVAYEHQQYDVLNYLMDREITFFQNSRESCLGLSFLGMFSTFFALILSLSSDNKEVSMACSISAMLCFFKIIFDKFMDFRQDKRIRKITSADTDVILSVREDSQPTIEV